MADAPIQRKLAAILYADVAGYSRLTGADEVGTHEALRVGLGLLTKAIESHGGRVNHYAGDAILAEFGSVVDCVTTAIHAQRTLAAENEDVPDDKKLQFRIGVHSGEVMIDGTEIYGDDVNIAARLEALAEPGGICVSGIVENQTRHRIDVAVEDMGDQRVKNIANPIRAYRIVLDRKVEPAAAPSQGKPSIAVLPFDNLSGDPEQEYFSDGIAEDIITALSGISQLHVSARNSTFSYKGQSPNIRDVAKDLYVRYVLEGSVRKAANKVRISVQLIDGLSGNHLWAERYDRDLEDIFAVQDEITGTVLGAILPEISRAEIERARAKHTDNLDAWDLYQRGLFHAYRHARGDIDIAVELLRKSIELAPDMANAHAELARALVWQLREFTSQDGGFETVRERVDEAVQAGRAAVKLDGNDPASYVGLGAALTARAGHIDGNFDEAISTFQHSLALNPTSAAGHAEIGLAQAVAGHAKDGIEHFLTAIRLSPRDLSMGRMMSTLALAYFADGDFDATIEWTTKCRRTAYDLLWMAMAARVIALSKTGREAEARAELDMYKEENPSAMKTLKNWRGTIRDDLLDGLKKIGMEVE